MNNPTFLFIVAGIGFGVWPLMGRLSKLPSLPMGVAVTFGTFLPLLVALLAFPEPAGKTAWTGRGVMVCLAAGLINGLGVLAYSFLVSNPAVNLSRYVPMTVCLMALTAFLGALLIFGEAFTTKKAVGIALGLGAIWLLK